MFRKLRNTKGSAEGIVLFLWLLTGSIAVGETLKRNDLLGDPVAQSGENISSKLASQYWKP